MKKGFINNIEALTLDNDAYRNVLYTGAHLQLVVMCVQPGDELGAEVHEHHDQFIRVEAGSGYVEIDGVKTPIEDDFAIIIPAGADHNVVNTGDEPLKLYTIYGAPEHRLDVYHATKADEKEEHFDGRTTE
ncbi:MAG: cupin domain-containing protein [Gammaproteobacteria bacterium]|nr:cupin domain-containing protein [Gammaproteobacteria bacterium]